MNKNEIFTFTAPNGAEVRAVVIDCLGTCNFEEVIDSKHWEEKYLCYAQNRLFYHTEWTQIDKVIDGDFVPANDEENDWYYAIMYHSHDVKTTGSTQEVLVDHCILPDYDEMLARYNDIEVAQAENINGM
jgi:hypothetical protein